MMKQKKKVIQALAGYITTIVLISPCSSKKSNFTTIENPRFLTR